MVKRRYEALDALRGVAALAVVGYHATTLAGNPRVPHGYLAVDFFFCLSGFVIAAAYEDRLRRAMSFAAFVKARVIRLWPMIVAGSVLGAAVQMALAPGMHPALLALLFAASASLTPLALGGAYFELYPLNGPFWSLLFEMIANLAYARLIRRMSDWVLAAVAALGLAGMIAGVVLIRGSLNTGFSFAEAPFGLARVAFSFSLGVLIFRRELRLAAPKWVTLGALAIVMIAPGGWWTGAYDLVCAAIVLPTLVVLGANDKGSAGAPLRLLGEISYPLYAIHYPLARLFGVWAKAYAPSGVLGAALIALEVFVAVTAAFAITRLFDEPVRARIGALWAKARSNPAGPKTRSTSGQLERRAAPSERSRPPTRPALR